MALLLNQLAKSWPPPQWCDLTVVVAVSGGPDSVALLHALQRLRGASARGTLVAAHFNHGWRGAASEGDQRFVEQLCQELDLPSRCGTADPFPAGDPAQGDPDIEPGQINRAEAAARDERYRFFRQAALDVSARFVVTAHTADDQAETILHRILRGTGVAGLAGIPRTRVLAPHVTLLRPLLEVRHTDVLSYLSAEQLPFRRDSSNAEVRWTRNRIRHELLPHLAQRYNPQIVEALLRLGSLASDGLSERASAIGEAEGRCRRCVSSEQIIFDGPQWASLEPWLRRETLIRAWKEAGWPLQAMTYQKWAAVAELPDGPDRPRLLTLPGTIQVRWDCATLNLRRQR